MNPTAPPLKRGKPGMRTGWKRRMTCSTTASPSLTPFWPMAKLSVTFPFSISSTLRAGLPDDGAGIAADERVAANVLAAFHRFEEERLALAANLAIGRERRFQIRQNAARDRDQVALAGQFQEFRLRRIIHGAPFLPHRRRKRHNESRGVKQDNAPNRPRCRSRWRTEWYPSSQKQISAAPMRPVKHRFAQQTGQEKGQAGLRDALRKTTRGRPPRPWNASATPNENCAPPPAGPR